MQSSSRKKLLWLHTWSGLTIGVVVLFLALTGAGLVLKPQLEEHVYRELHVVPACTAPLALDQLAAVARASHPAARLHSIEVVTDNTASVAVMFTDKDYVFVDPCSARVLGVQNQYGGFFGVADWLHRFRFIADNKLGRVLAGWANTVFLVLLLGVGLLLWWPRTRQAWRGALKFNPRLPGSARTLSLHKAVGLYTALVLLVITLTGMPLAFEPVKELIYRSTAYVAPVKPLSAPAPVGARKVSIEAFWQKTRALVPSLEWVSLRYPLKPGAAYEAEIVEKGAPHSIAKGYHYMDAYSGVTLRLEHYGADQHIGRKIYLYCIAIHAGMVGGLAWQMLLLIACLGVAVQAYSGASPYLRRVLRTPARDALVLKLVKRSVEADGICSFEFADPAGKALPSFAAGAHIDVRVGDGPLRQYSLCNDPDETHRYVIAVLRHAESRGGSRAMHELLQVGDTVQASLPKNHFPLEHAAARSLLLAGGIGITPILCMAERLARAGAEFELHYCARSPRHAAFLGRIGASSFARRVAYYFSDEGAAGRIDFDKVLARPHGGAHLYVCGPAGFMDAALAAATRQGWPAAQLHREYFAGAVAETAQDVAFDVKLASSGKVIRVGQSQTVLDALTAHGVEVQTSCAEGVCGSCLTRVLEGEPLHRDVFLTAQERALKDRFLPCCSRSCGGMLVLDL